MRYYLKLLVCLSVPLAASSPSFAVTNYLPNRDKPVPADQPIPTVDFVRPQLFEQPELSPDGRYFAALTKDEELRSTLLVCDIGTGKVLSNRTDVRAFSWVSNEYLMINWWQGSVMKSTDSERIVDVTAVIPADKYGLMADTGYFRTYDEQIEPHYDRSNIDRKWYSPTDGGLKYCLIARDDGLRHLYRYEKRKWIECPVNLDEITPIEIGDQPNEMLVLGPAAKGETRGIQRMDVTTGKLGEIIYRDPRHDCVPYITFKRGTREIAAVHLAKVARHTVWLRETERAIQKLIDQQFKGSLARIVSMDVKEAHFMIEVQSDRQPPVYYILDWENKSLGLVKNTAPWIDPARMCAAQIMNYKNRDGVVIEGLLMLPANASKEHPVPMLAFINGGPWNVGMTWGWAPAVQCFATRGYAVFVPNYRGSAGTDSRFVLRDRFDFEKMANDVADGIAALSKTGLIDTKHIGAYGLGFGSYLALYGASEKTNPYRCAVIHGGVFDWEQAFSKTDSSNWLQLRWLQKHLQDYGLHPPSMYDRHNDIQIPVFFTRNVEVLDITEESQAWSMFRRINDHPDCRSFGDLNLYTFTEAYKDAVDRIDAIEKFFDEHLKAK